MVIGFADDGLDIVIRPPAPLRLCDLGRTVFSAAMQDWRPAAIHVLCRSDESAPIGAALRPILAIVPEVRLTLGAPPAAWGGRYLACLGPDEVIYPEGFRLLIEALRSGEAAVAEGGALAAVARLDGVVPYIRTKRALAAAAPLGVVVDRRRIDAADLAAGGTGWDHERLVARYAVNQELRETALAERRIVGDGPFEKG